MFIGNSRGLISYAMGKGNDYEAAMESCFKKMKKNMICLDIDTLQTSCTILEGRHNDYKIKILP